MLLGATCPLDDVMPLRAPQWSRLIGWKVAPSSLHTTNIYFNVWLSCIQARWCYFSAEQTASIHSVRSSEWHDVIQRTSRAQQHIEFRVRLQTRRWEGRETIWQRKVVSILFRRVICTNGSRTDSHFYGNIGCLCVSWNLPPPPGSIVTFLVVI